MTQNICIYDMFNQCDYEPSVAKCNAHIHREIHRLLDDEVKKRLG